MIKKRVAIFVPLAMPMGMIHKDFFLSFFEANEFMLTHLPKDWNVEFQMHSPSTFPIDANRNHCVGIMKDGNYDTSIWLDVDQELSEDTLYRLLVEGEGYPIYAGIYYLKKHPHHPIVFQARDKSFKTFNPIWNYPSEKLFYADMIGMGCVKIDREVFEATDAPYFKYQPVPEALAKTSETMAFKKKHRVYDVSEDVYFWKQVHNKTDYRIVIDPLVQVGHISSHVVTPQEAIKHTFVNYRLSLNKDGDKFLKWWGDNFPEAELVNPNGNETRWIFDQIRQREDVKV